MNTARRSPAGAGTQTSALAFGGFLYPTTNATEEYDGTSWTTGGNLGTPRTTLGGSGIQTAALAFGGLTDTDAGLSATELYNGTSWTANPTGLNTARGQLGGSTAGTQTSALAFAGYTGTTPTAATEEWTGPGVGETKTVTVS
jgi:hypothetical protein